MASSKSRVLWASQRGLAMDGDEEGDEEACARQLRSTLRESLGEVEGEEVGRKPLLTHLNADTTWLLSLPLPEFNWHLKDDGSGKERNTNAENEGAERSVDGKRERDMKGKKYFHILIDPWLKGGQSDVAGWFSQQWHVVKSCVEFYSELQELIRGLEDTSSTKEGGLDGCGVGDVGVDLVVISHEFTDHMHKETLLDLPGHIPVMATSKAAGLIRSWKHFDVVKDVERFDGDWRNSSLARLGLDEEWLGVSRVAYAGTDLLYYHSAILLTFSNTPSSTPQGVIYTPHGISPQDLAPLATAEPRIDTLALLHGLQDIALPMGAQLNRGAHNGLSIQRMVGAKWWVGTHDEVKKGGGLVSYFLRRKLLTLKEAMEQEAEITGGVSEKRALADVKFVELECGESLLLE